MFLQTTRRQGVPWLRTDALFIGKAHGDWARAWKFNPAGIYFFAVVLCQLPYRAWQLWRMRRGQDELDGGRLTVFVLGILIAGLLVQWVVRLAGPFDR